MQSFSLFVPDEPYKTQDAQLAQSPQYKRLGLKFEQCRICPDRITALYRGFVDVKNVLFDLPTLVLGLFGRTIPIVLNIDNIHQHKIVNEPSKYYFVAFSENETIASGRGNGNYITIDPMLLRPFLVDVDGTHALHRLTYPQRMLNEREQVCVAVPYFCIKTIYIDHRPIPNPFYLAIACDNACAKTDFDALYSNYIDLLRNQYETGFTPEVLSQCKIFSMELIKFYKKYADQNLLALTPVTLQTIYPRFMEYFIAANQARLLNNDYRFFDPNKTLQDMLNELGSDALTQHAYTKDREAIKKMQTAVVKNCYEDEYSRPQYD